MTKEELEKDYYADRPTEPYSADDCANDWANIAYYAEENLEKAFKRIAVLEAQIKKMKRHANCKYCDSEGYCEVRKTYLVDLSYDGCDKWELEN